MLYKFWTNFNLKRASTGDYEVLSYDPEVEGYWWFETTIDPEYLFDMDPTNLRRFLFRMVDFYKHEDN